MGQLGIDFDVVVPDVEELEEGPPAEVAVENAYRKASAVSGPLVLGVDTVVALGTRLYGKPVDEATARDTLSALSGRRHAVISGVCLISQDGRPRTAAATTYVDFRALGSAMLDWYVGSGEWRERAGGYAIQGRGVALVERIEGDYSNVVGLPVATLLQMAPGLLGQ